eukprot:TRINITY_DN9190_c0_g2_i1.p1 TRINITY_DN9190_c0_g2~~TRINITY_DN9190_c0_g2_i1.p1  ORF type:complete len:594 (+),score=104.17 TRINITY_DN9190_c0_g2_i1:42-1784(+)
MLDSSAAHQQNLSKEAAAARIQKAFRRSRTRQRREHEEPEIQDVEAPAENLMDQLIVDAARAMVESQRVSMREPVDFQLMEQRYRRQSPGYVCYPKRLQPLRAKIYMLFEEPGSSIPAKILAMTIFACIVLSIGLFMAETMPDVHGLNADHEFWVGCEIFFVVIFSFEYVLRLLVCDVGGGTITRFVRTPMQIVDIVAILPFFLGIILEQLGVDGEAAGFIRLVRLVRLFRVLKLVRYSAGLKLVMVALGNSLPALGVLVFFLGIGSVLFSSMVFHVEKLMCPARSSFTPADLAIYLSECHDTRDSQFGLCCNEDDNPLDFPSILSAFWWSIVTMTTVGFGDVYPRTVPGRVIGTLTMLFGILLLALPIALIGAKFQEAYNHHMAMRGGEVVQIRKKNERKDRDEVGLKNMSTRMRLLKFSDTSLALLARELSKELEEASRIQEDIKMFEKAELDAQAQALDCCQTLISRLQYFADAALQRKERDEGEESEREGIRQDSAVELDREPAEVESRKEVGKEREGLKKSSSATSVAEVGIPAPRMLTVRRPSEEGLSLLHDGSQAPHSSASSEAIPGVVSEGG